MEDWRLLTNVIGVTFVADISRRFGALAASSIVVRLRHGHPPLQLDMGRLEAARLMW